MTTINTLEKTSHYPEFRPWPKISRLFRSVVITEKTDGTNAAVIITRDYVLDDSKPADIVNGGIIVDLFPDDLEQTLVWVGAQSRKNLITPEKDNFGFARWVREHAWELVALLGEGRHFGEWWGCLSYETSIRLADGSLEKIGKIVNNQLDVQVLSYNFEKGCLEPKKIIGYKKQEATNDWLTIAFKRKHRGGRQPHLNVTSNHILYRKDKNNRIQEVMAADLNIGDKIFMASENPGHLQQQLILGSILGDGSIQDHSFHVAHANHDLVNTKIKILDNLVISVDSRISGKGSLMKTLSTKSLSLVREIEELLYQNGVKDINADYIDLLGPAALAFWYIDDGSLQESLVRSPVSALYTNGFTEKGVREAANKLTKRGYENYIVFNDGKPIIKFTPNGTKRLHLDIAAFIPWEMKYKILPEYRNIIPIWENSDIIKNETTNLVETEIIDITDDYLRQNRSKVRYDIEVEDNHNFFANGILVHNSGIQRGYGLEKGEKRFSLFNVHKFEYLNNSVVARELGIATVPVIDRYEVFDTQLIKESLEKLRVNGSYAAPGFDRPEGIVIFHEPSQTLFKTLIENDDIPKGNNE